MSSTTLNAQGAGYSLPSRVFHWASALLIFIIIPIAWWATTLDRDDPDRLRLDNLHRSIGMTILALTIARLIWRRVDPTPSLDGLVSPLLKSVAKIEYLLLYLLLLAMPISGYVMSGAANHPVAVYGLFTIPSLLPVSPELHRFAHRFHNLSQYALYALLALHLAAVSFHVFVRKDSLVKRMIRLS